MASLSFLFKSKLRNFNQHLKRLLTDKHTKPALFVAAFAVVGIIALLVTRAATPYASLEPEQGTLTGTACQVNESSASNGTAVQFGGCPSVVTTSQISQYGITWTFDKAYPSGQFANGDYWVVGPVKVTSISPGWNGSQNGSVLNPVVTSNQGFDARLFNADYDANANVADGLSASNPLTIGVGNSLVSSIGKSSGNDDLNRPYLRVAAVLTVLTAPAPTGSFRPPFAGGADKSVRFNKSQLDYTKLAKVVAPAGSTPPALSTVERYFERPWLDVAGFGWMAQYFNPVENLKPYGVYVGEEVELGALSLNLNYTDAQKEKLLINMVQVGIDLYALSQTPEGNTRWSGAGGHNHGRKLPIIIAGMVLNDAAMKSPAAVFSEDDQTAYGAGWSGDTVLFQHVGGHSHESKHPRDWTVDGRGQAGDPPAGYDSDFRDELYRHCCSGGVWPGQALSARLMGAVDEWNHQAFFDYVDRWMTQDWAPYEVIITQETGQDAPNSHGSTSSDFIRAMWGAYR